MNIFRHPEGDKKGSNPSSTSTMASASQKVSASTEADYFLPAGGRAAVAEPRIALKKSDDGSSTITSFFLLKLVL